MESQPTLESLQPSLQRSLRIILAAECVEHLAARLLFKGICLQNVRVAPVRSPQCGGKRHRLVQALERALRIANVLVVGIALHVRQPCIRVHHIELDLPVVPRVPRQPVKMLDHTLNEKMLPASSPGEPASLGNIPPGGSATFTLASLPPSVGSGGLGGAIQLIPGRLRGTYLGGTFGGSIR